jgi:photosystem II stability/assembly factor-like uncharacterized protein
MGCGDYASLVFAPSDPNRAYARTCSNSVARTDNAVSAASCSGVAWTEVTPTAGLNPPALWTRAMTAVHPTNPDRVYFARARDVAVSIDAGNTLTPSAFFPGDGAQPVSVYVDAAGTIYAGTLEHGAFTSTDDGASWTPWALNSPAPRAVMNIAYSSAAGGTFFLATTDGLYRLLPGGTWTQLSPGGAGYTVSDVEVDPGCPTRVYAALGFVGSLGVHRGGVLVSTDNGTTWSSITSGLTLHQAPIPDIQVDPSDSRYLYAAVYGQGAWVYDQGSTPSCPPLLDTPTPTITSTPTPTPTFSSSPTETPTPSVTAVASATPTEVPTETPTSVPTLTPSHVACWGDCDGLGVVTVDELLTLVNIALGNIPTSDCKAGDVSGDGQITVDEILTAVNNALSGCPRPPLP